MRPDRERHDVDLDLPSHPPITVACKYRARVRPAGDGVTRQECRWMVERASSEHREVSNPAEKTARPRCASPTGVRAGVSCYDSIPPEREETRPGLPTRDPNPRHNETGTRPQGWRVIVNQPGRFDPAPAHDMLTFPPPLTPRSNFTSLPPSREDEDVCPAVLRLLEQAASGGHGAV